MSPEGFTDQPTCGEVNSHGNHHFVDIYPQSIVLVIAILILITVLIIHLFLHP